MIRLNIKKNQSTRLKRRLKNKVIIRKRIFGDSTRPRLVVFRSHKHIYAQLINDLEQKTLLESSSLKEDMKGLKKIEQAHKVGESIAKKAQEKGIKKLYSIEMDTSIMDVFKKLLKGQEKKDFYFKGEK